LISTPLICRHYADACYAFACADATLLPLYAVITPLRHFNISPFTGHFLHESHRRCRFIAFAATRSPPPLRHAASAADARGIDMMPPPLRHCCRFTHYADIAAITIYA